MVLYEYYSELRTTLFISDLIPTSVSQPLADGWFYEFIFEPPFSDPPFLATTMVEEWFVKTSL
jgi:hypothetical protein